MLRAIREQERGARTAPSATAPAAHSAVPSIYAGHVPSSTGGLVASAPAPGGLVASAPAPSSTGGLVAIAPAPSGGASLRALREEQMSAAAARTAATCAVDPACWPLRVLPQLYAVDGCLGTFSAACVARQVDGCLGTFSAACVARQVDGCLGTSPLPVARRVLPQLCAVDGCLGTFSAAQLARPVAAMAPLPSLVARRVLPRLCAAPWAWLPLVTSPLPVARRVPPQLCALRSSADLRQWNTRRKG
jgi:hypothetical protein